MENMVVVCSLAANLVVVRQIYFFDFKTGITNWPFFHPATAETCCNQQKAIAINGIIIIVLYHCFFGSDYQRMSQSERGLSSKNEDLEKESSSQGASHKCTADRKPIANLKLVKQL